MNELASNLEQTIDQAEALGRLRAITRRIETFFELQMNKLNQATEQLHRLASQNDAALRMASDVEQQRQLFELDKEGETQRLIEAGEKLAEAWAELEDQQRQLGRPRAVATPRNESVHGQNGLPEKKIASDIRSAGKQRRDIGKPVSAAGNDQTNQLPARVETRDPQSAETADVSEAALFEMKLLQQQVAEHARRHNR